MSRGTVETLDYVAFAKRVIRGAGKRVAQGYGRELAELLSLRDEVESAIATAVGGMREQGHSWQYIADGLGITRQSAHQRYAERIAS